MNRVACFLMLLLSFLVPGWNICESAAKKHNEEVQSQESDQKEAVLHMKGVYLEEFNESGRSLQLWAESGTYSRLEKQVELSKVRVLVPPQKAGQAKRVELTGDRGQADMEQKAVHINGDVQILTDDGYHIRTGHATYYYEAREIQSNDHVYMEGPEGATEGSGLHVWIEKEVVLLRQNVNTQLKPEALEKAKEKIKP